VAWSDADGLQGLHWAARQGQTAALQVLLEAGANAEGRCMGVAGTIGSVFLLKTSNA
jgi:ankyrin repeat protein